MPPHTLLFLKLRWSSPFACSELLSPVPYAIYFWIARDGLIQSYPNYTDASLRRDGPWNVVPLFHSASTVRWEETAQDTASLPRRKGNSGFGLPDHRTQASKLSVCSRKGPLWASLSGCLSFIGKLLTGCKGYPLCRDAFSFVNFLYLLPCIPFPSMVLAFLPNAGTFSSPASLPGFLSLCQTISLLDLPFINYLPASNPPGICFPESFFSH